jgi:hypothetical protein
MGGAIPPFPLCLHGMRRCDYITFTDSIVKKAVIKDKGLNYCNSFDLSTVATLINPRGTDNVLSGVLRMFRFQFLHLGTTPTNQNNSQRNQERIKL